MFFLHRTALLATAVVGLGLLCIGPSAKAQIINGGFESGLTGWTVSAEGQAASVGIVQGVGPQEGSFQARLRSGGDYGGATSKAALDAFIGGGADLNTIRPSSASAHNVAQGTAIQQTFSGAAGDVLSLRFNFLTRENVGELLSNDFSFVHLAGFERLAAVNSGEFPVDTNPGISIAAFLDDVHVRQQDGGYSTFSTILPTTGTYTLTIGVVDMRDPAIASALLLDAVTLTGSATAAPEPGALALMACGLLPIGGVIVRRIRHRG